MGFVQREIQRIACDIGSLSSFCCGDCEKCHKDPTDDSCNFIHYGRRLYERGYRPPCKDTVTISEEMFKELMNCKTKDLSKHIVLTREAYEKIQRQLTFYQMRIRQYEQEESDRNLLVLPKLEGERTWYKKNEIDAIKGQVRKENAKDILEKVGNIEDCRGICLKQYAWFTNLCKENDVEVK